MRKKLVCKIYEYSLNMNEAFSTKEENNKLKGGKMEKKESLVKRLNQNDFNELFNRVSENQNVKREICQTDLTANFFGMKTGDLYFQFYNENEVLETIILED